MPKLNRDFPCPLSIAAECELKNMLIAMGYHRGDGGKYAAISRHYLWKGLRDQIKAMPPDERERYEQILSNQSQTMELETLLAELT